MIKKALTQGAVLSLLLSQTAAAQLAVDGCDESTMQNYQNVAVQAADREYQNVIQPVVRRPANITQLSCLDRFVNPKGVDILFDVSGLLSGLVNDLMTKACAAADQVWNQVPSLGAVYTNQIAVPPGMTVNNSSASSVKIYLPTNSNSNQKEQSNSILDSLFGRK